MAKYYLLGFHKEGTATIGTLIEVREGRLERIFLHEFTPEETLRLFVPHGGIRAVWDKFYSEYLGMEVTL